jgi:four helix bundle protein
MPLPLSNRKLQIYLQAKKLVHHCYIITQQLSNEDVTNLNQQLKTAAATVYINIAQGLFKKKKRRRKHFENVADLLIVMNAIIELFAEFKLISEEQLKEADQLITLLYAYTTKGKIKT